MRYVKCLLAALAAGAVAGGLWAVLVYASGREWMIITLGIGAVIGLAARFAMGEKGDAQAAGIAAAVTLLAVAGGRYAVIRIMVHDQLSQLVVGAEEMTDEDAIRHFAFVVIDERETAGTPVAWPYGISADTAVRPIDFPDGVWEEAASRWRSMPADEQAAFRNDLAELMRLFVMAEGATIRDETILGSFDVFTIVCGLGAVATAWGVAASKPSPTGPVGPLTPAA